MVDRENICGPCLHKQLESLQTNVAASSCGQSQIISRRKCHTGQWGPSAYLASFLELESGQGPDRAGGWCYEGEGLRAPQRVEEGTEAHIGSSLGQEHPSRLASMTVAA